MGGNTELLLDIAPDELRRLGVSVEKVRLSMHEIKPCTECRYCVGRGSCRIDYGMSSVLIPKLLSADIVVASPLYFNNVSSYVKLFMDRACCIRGKLRNKVGGGIVVGRAETLDCSFSHRSISFRASQRY